ncbi:hypothetical protein EIG75_20525 [Pseudomonas syringae]|uniref:Uncharacterized protein n=1 Tax=Pseudomonas syringae TaxID=317 RepID=A0A6B2B181_PSESX|nr:hypothetical protein [Pseudomonas syringae]NAO45414.1 hypothetical protein [Pseudomonas syringae]NAO50376.1 hypothetical protein [Pseudomonas syringae]NAO63996.1 hypothetical protein [Pseudomonas syringae]NAO68953.1 hypothetical protein [Pseudomonas syringae]
MCVPHVIGEKMLAQQMAQANKELKAGIEVCMLAPPQPMVTIPKWRSTTQPNGPCVSAFYTST